MLKFSGWKGPSIYEDKSRKVAFLHAVARNSENAFKNGMTGPHSGRMYGSHQASAPGEFPANHKGPLLASIASEVRGSSEMEVGSNKFYSKFLAHGTRKMRPRKMSKEALQIGVAGSFASLRGFVRFV